jgi:hypothetical protein
VNLIQCSAGIEYTDKESSENSTDDAALVQVFKPHLFILIVYTLAVTTFLFSS